MEGEQDEGLFLGVEGESFDFLQVPFDIKFIGSDIKSDIKDIKRFINKSILN